MPRENPRYKNVNGSRIQMTEAEEIARDAEEAYEADPQRDIDRTEAIKNNLLNAMAAKNGPLIKWIIDRTGGGLDLEQALQDIKDRM